MTSGALYVEIALGQTRQNVLSPDGQGHKGGELRVSTGKLCSYIGDIRSSCITCALPKPLKENAFHCLIFDALVLFKDIQCFH